MVIRCQYLTRNLDDFRNDLLLHFVRNGMHNFLELQMVDSWNTIKYYCSMIWIFNAYFLIMKLNNAFVPDTVFKNCSFAHRSCKELLLNIPLLMRCYIVKDFFHCHVRITYKANRTQLDVVRLFQK